MQCIMKTICSMCCYENLNVGDLALSLFAFPIVYQLPFHSFVVFFCSVNIVYQLDIVVYFLLKFIFSCISWNLFLLYSYLHGHVGLLFFVSCRDLSDLIDYNFSSISVVNIKLGQFGACFSSNYHDWSWQKIVSWLISIARLASVAICTKYYYYLFPELQPRLLFEIV